VADEDRGGRHRGIEKAGKEERREERVEMEQLRGSRMTGAGRSEKERDVDKYVNIMQVSQ
jgi:hypothetical protein